MVLEEGTAQNKSKEEWIPEVMSAGGASTSSSSANVHFMLINCFQIAGGSATGKALSNCPAFVWLVFWQSAPPTIQPCTSRIYGSDSGGGGCGRGVERMCHALCTHHLLR